ncbi:hypothetical protein Tco_1119241 [Tanacetum coccineum]
MVVGRPCIDYPREDKEDMCDHSPWLVQVSASCALHYSGAKCIRSCSSDMALDYVSESPQSVPEYQGSYSKAYSSRLASCLPSNGDSWMLNLLVRVFDVYWEKVKDSALRGGEALTPLPFLFKNGVPWVFINTGGIFQDYIEMEDIESLVFDLLASVVVYQGGFGVLVRDLDVTPRSLGEVSDINKKTKTRQKPDKTEHEIGKSEKSRS